MTPKIDKVAGEIKKTKAKIIELQEYQRKMEQQKTDMENTEIVRIMRNVSIPLHELGAFMEAYQIRSAAQVVPANREAEKSEE